MAKRVFLIVLDSFGIGGAPDAAAFGDEGSNTLAAVLSDSDKPFPNLAKMGLFAIDGELYYYSSGPHLEVADTLFYSADHSGCCALL